MFQPGPGSSQDTALYDGRWGEDGVLQIIDSAARPRTTITLEGVSPSDPGETTQTAGTATGKFTMRVRFGEAVSGFTQDDFDPNTHANTTYDGINIGLRVSNFTTVSQSEYTIELVPDRSGVATIIVPRGAAASVSGGEASEVASVVLRIDLAANPAFTREVAENATAGTALGGPIRFDNPPVGIDAYSMSGPSADVNAFTIDRSTGQLRTKAGVTYDHDTKGTYRVVVTGSSTTDPKSRASVEVTIFVVADQDPPLAPGRPSVSRDTGTDLSVSWTAPDNSGRPAITGYRTRYRVSPNGNWQTGPSTTGATGVTLTNLQADTRYDVQVQARNSEGSSPWSESGPRRRAAT